MNGNLRDWHLKWTHMNQRAILLYKEECQEEVELKMRIEKERIDAEQKGQLL